MLPYDHHHPSSPSRGGYRWLRSKALDHVNARRGLRRAFLECRNSPRKVVFRVLLLVLLLLCITMWRLHVPAARVACEDGHGECEAWARRGDCGRDPAYMREACPLSCGSCHLVAGEGGAGRAGLRPAPSPPADHAETAAASATVAAPATVAASATVAAASAATAAVAAGVGAAAAGALECVLTTGGGRVPLPRERRNDDYCDCADGSDEPATSACAGAGRGASGARFRCAADVPARTIPVSRVEDGVCDCCDGSDEPSGRVSCGDTCAALQAAEAARGGVRQRGARVRAEYEAAAAARPSQLEAAGGESLLRAAGATAFGALSGRCFKASPLLQTLCPSPPRSPPSPCLPLPSPPPQPPLALPFARRSPAASTSTRSASTAARPSAGEARGKLPSPSGGSGLGRPPAPWVCCAEGTSAAPARSGRSASRSSARRARSSGQ